MADQTQDGKKRPPWLVGLVIALFLFMILLIVINLLGYGDEPAVGATAAFGFLTVA